MPSSTAMSGRCASARVSFFQSVLDSIEKCMRTRYGASREPCTCALTKPLPISMSTMWP